ncbi:MAG TPA: HAMP domain-containing sensor histidine kinase [Chloroflexia bacterium]|nr:HAMP domain-containing sensor histidine kinase [Chloroflexia bacterium]
MRWSRFGLKTKILATHLLVVAASTVALLLAVLLVFGILAPLSLGSNTIFLAFGLVVVIALSGATAAILASRWLGEQLTVPLRQASALARRLARGQYPARAPRGKDEGLALPDNDDLRDLVVSLDDLATSLEAAEGRRTELFGEIIHELRTPIAILEGYFEGLLDGHVKPSDQTWAMLYDVTSRAHRLVDKLQALARAESRQDPPDLQAVDPGLIAQAALDRMRLHLEEKGLDVVASIPEGLPLVLADADYAIQVLMNLLTNALRYTPVPGTVTLAVSRLTDAVGATSATGGREVVFRVTDTGLGIAAEHLPHLYERFFRVDRSYSQATGSSGIGLPVAKALVEAMGGRIWAESPGPGQGSSFSFTLLISPDPCPA